MNSTSFLIIESRDCIASPENYSIVVTINVTDTKLLNVTFNSNIQYDVGDQLMPNIHYIIRTVIIEMTSSTVIDENITIIMYSTSTDPTGYSLYMHISSIMHVHVGWDTPGCVGRVGWPSKLGIQVSGNCFYLFDL